MQWLLPHSHLASALFRSPSSSCKETGTSHRKVPGRALEGAGKAKQSSLSPSLMSSSEDTGLSLHSTVSCRSSSRLQAGTNAHTWRKRQDVSPPLRRSFPRTNTGPKFLDTACCTDQAGASKGRFDSCCCRFPWRRTHHVTSGIHAATRAPLS